MESLRGQAIAKQLRETVQTVQNELGKRIYELCLKYKINSIKNLHITDLINMSLF